MKPAPRVPLRPSRLLDPVRERIRHCHHSLRTELSCVHWADGFVRCSGPYQPREMGAAEVEAFLFHLSDDRHAAASRNRRASSAFPVLYREVRATELRGTQQVGRLRARNGFRWRCRWRKSTVFCCGLLSFEYEYCG
jgi:hypothetical protein